jgi:hypothetical protein
MIDEKTDSGTPPGYRWLAADLIDEIADSSRRDVVGRDVGVRFAGSLLVTWLCTEAMTEERIDSGTPLGYSLLIDDMIDETTDPGRTVEVGRGVIDAVSLVLISLCTEAIADERIESGAPLG